MAREINSTPFDISNVKFKMLDEGPVYSGEVTCPECNHKDRCIVWPIGWWTASQCTGCKKSFSHPLHYCQERTDNECHCVDVDPSDLITFAKTGIKPPAHTDLHVRCRILEELNSDLSEKYFDLKYQLETLRKQTK